VDGRDLVNHDHPQVIEIWNLVFMQYNRKADGSLEPLPARVIDTGMGFERLCMALQGKTSNYDTDVFTPLIDKIASLSGKKYGENAKVDVAMRVIADHVRTISFSIADSQLPSNAKAGYVIRRILRRAVRYAYTFLDQKEAFMYRLVDTLIESMGEAYPELVHQRELIIALIDKILAQPITQLPTVIQKASTSVTTDLSIADIIALAEQFKDEGDLVVYNAMVPSYPQDIGGISYVINDAEMTAEMMEVVEAGEDPAEFVSDKVGSYAPAEGSSGSWNGSYTGS